MVFKSGGTHGLGVSWSEADDNTLRTFASDGKSATKVADLLGRSRSAVLGRASRLKVKFGASNTRPVKSMKGIPKRAKPSVPVIPPVDQKPKASRVVAGIVMPKSAAAHPNDFRARAEQRAASPGIAERESAMAVAPQSRNLKLVDLELCMCKWPVEGTGTEARFCGVATGDVLTIYCTYHSRMAYQPAHSRSARR
jgi:GcrA cell cycle regulator